MVSAGDNKVATAFHEAFREALQAQGGSVYSGQDVAGLSDVPADAPLLATLRLLSGAVIELSGGDEPTTQTTTRRRFLAQSCFKPLTFAMALEHGLADQVALAVASVGDAPFGTFALSSDGRALNPLINSGALCVLELLSRSTTVDEVGAWCRSLGGASTAGSSSSSSSHPIFDPRAVAATEADSLRNRGLCCQLASAGVIPKTEDAVDRAVRYYSAMDCMLTDTNDLAGVAAAFADGGSSADLAATTRTATLSAMLHSGMYEASGSWAATVGLPAKSGVGGAVWVVLPGIGGLCAQQPRIDSAGNSVQAMELVRGLVSRLPELNVFHGGKI